jgi:hypothetical protein
MVSCVTLTLKASFLLSKSFLHWTVCSSPLRSTTLGVGCSAWYSQAAFSSLWTLGKHKSGLEVVFALMGSLRTSWFLRTLLRFKETWDACSGLLSRLSLTPGALLSPE